MTNYLNVIITYFTTNMLYFLFTISQQLELLAYTKYTVPDSESCVATHLPGTRWLLPCKLVPPYRCGICVCRCAGTSSSSPQGKWHLPWMNGTAWWPSFFLLWLTSCSGYRKQPQRVNKKNDNKKQNNVGQVRVQGVCIHVRPSVTRPTALQAARAQWGCVNLMCIGSYSIVPQT